VTNGTGTIRYADASRAGDLATVAVEIDRASTESGVYPVVLISYLNYVISPEGQRRSSRNQVNSAAVPSRVGAPFTCRSPTTAEVVTCAA
jgi:hypothetical protein